MLASVDSIDVVRLVDVEEEDDRSGERVEEVGLVAAVEAYLPRVLRRAASEERLEEKVDEALVDATAEVRLVGEQTWVERPQQREKGHDQLAPLVALVARVPYDATQHIASIEVTCSSVEGEESQDCDSVDRRDAAVS